MLTFWFCLAIIQASLFFWLGHQGTKLVTRIGEESRAAHCRDKESWPLAAMIVPVAGEHPEMENSLRSLLRQDYPGLVHVFATRTDSEPAADLIRKLQKDYPGLRHVVAGDAAGCGQKNRNSLKAVQSLGQDVDVYLFCDSTHIAGTDLARCLVAPIMRGKSSFCTGYHTVMPGDEQPVTLAYALCVLLMRFLQSVARLTQPWGGAMAISRKEFEAQGIAALWQNNVVDDCSLAAHLQKRGIPVHLAAAALLETRAEKHGLKTWLAWLDRQVLFLKFCIPGQWRQLGLLAALMALPPLLALLTFIAGFVNIGEGQAMIVALVWLAGILVALGPWRAFLGRPVGMARWLQAFFLAAFAFAHVYARSIKANGILWGKRFYTVGDGGKVIAVRDQD